MVLPDPTAPPKPGRPESDTIRAEPLPRWIDDEAMMPDLRFDPSKAVTFDLTRASSTWRGPAARLLVPADGAPGARRRRRPRCDGRLRAHARRGDGPQGGRGRLSAAAERPPSRWSSSTWAASWPWPGWARWGWSAGGGRRCWWSTVAAGADGDALIEGVLAAAVEAAGGRAASTWPAWGATASRARFFLGEQRRRRTKVRGWLADGRPWGEALVRLQLRRRGSISPR